VGKVNFLKSASSAGSRIRNDYLPSLKLFARLDMNVVYQILKGIFECARLDLSVKVYRDELPLGIIILYVFRHSVPPNRSCSLFQY
jgi:hypothetical protein